LNRYEYRSHSPKKSATTDFNEILAVISELKTHWNANKYELPVSPCLEEANARKNTLQHLMEVNRTLNLHMNAIRKVCSSDLLTKQAMKKLLYEKIRTFLSYFSMYSRPQLRHLSYQGISFCMPVSKISAACDLSHVSFCETLKALRRAHQNERSAMLTSGFVLLHENARPHTASSSQALLEHFNWELFDYLPYSPDLLQATTTCLPT
jgi:regulator of replication initiation timing